MTDEQRAADLVAKWEHGDEKHRQWLRDIAIPDLEAAFAEVRLEPKWLPIESAPLDGTFVLCALESGHVTVLQFCRFGYWRRNVMSEVKSDPVHWMPLPKAPR